MNLNVFRHRSASRPRRVVAGALLLTVALASCYRTEPLPVVEPVTGTRIVADLTREGTERMAEMIGSNVYRVEGDLQGIQNGEWRISMRQTYQPDIPPTPWAGEAITFPETYLGTVRERRLDTVRTVGLVGVIGAGLAALAVSFIQFVANDRDGQGGRTDPVQ